MIRKIPRSAFVVTSAASALSLLALASCAPGSAPPASAEVAAPPNVFVQMPVRAAPLRMSFLVSFRPTHPLGRAQALERGGRHAEAQELVAATLGDDGALRGLCFERFTVGGAELVLEVCEPSPWVEPLLAQRRWLTHLGATPGVAYVELNLVAQRESLARPS